MNTRTRHAVAAVAVTLLAAAWLVPLLASAGHLPLRDPNDASGPLDVKRVVVGDNDKRPRWTVRTWGRWSAKRIFDRGFVLVFFDTFGGRRFDYYALARSDGYRMRASLWRDRADKPDRLLVGLKEGRPDRRSLAMRVPFTKMRFGKSRVEYYWYAQTLITNRRCRRVCFDRAPNRDAVAEPVPGATPAPTIAPTTVLPTVTPGL